MNPKRTNQKLVKFFAQDDDVTAYQKTFAHTTQLHEALTLAVSYSKHHNRQILVGAIMPVSNEVIHYATVNPEETKIYSKAIELVYPLVK